jgi:hypothetical protein
LERESIFKGGSEIRGKNWSETGKLTHSYGYEKGTDAEWRPW